MKTYIYLIMIKFRGWIYLNTIISILMYTLRGIIERVPATRQNKMASIFDLANVLIKSFELFSTDVFFYYFKEYVPKNRFYSKLIFATV